MTNANIREAHKLLDALFDNSELSHKQIDLIRGLMPELPEPDAVKLNGDVKFFVCDGVQVRQDAESDHVQVYSKTFLTTTKARSLALALLAACEHTEKEQDNE